MDGDGSVYQIAGIKLGRKSSESDKLYEILDYDGQKWLAKSHLFILTKPCLSLK
jgi:hypothetical protein